MGYRKLPEGLKEKALSLIREGLNAHEVGRLTGLHHSTVARWVIRHGLQINPESVSKVFRNNCKKMISAGNYFNRRALIVSRGWPVETTLRGVKVVESLCDDGPQTSDQLSNGKQLVMRNGRSLLPHLERLGLIHSVPNVFRRKTVYFPTVLALDTRKAYLDRECEDVSRRGESTDRGSLVDIESSGKGVRQE